MESNIPKDFKLFIEYTKNPISIISFYLRIIQVITDESAYPFFQSTDGYTQLNKLPYVIATASESTYPHLEHCHVIWAVQRLAEIAYRSRVYSEINSNIVLKGRTDHTLLGNIKIQNHLAAEDSDFIGGTALNTSAPGLIEGEEAAFDSDRNVTVSVDSVNLGSNGTVLYHDPSSQENVKDMRIDVYFLPDHRILASLQLFITIIRALARLAVFQTSQVVGGWGYADAEMGIKIEIASDLGKSIKITYGDIIDALHFVIRTRLSQRRYEEMGGVFYTLLPERVDYGTLTVVNYQAPPIPSTVA